MIVAGPSEGRRLLAPIAGKHVSGLGRPDRQMGKSTEAPGTYDDMREVLTRLAD